MLIEREYLLGGLATLGLVTIFLPLCDGMGRQVTYGIPEELLRLSVKYGFEDRDCTEWLNKNVEETDRPKTRFETQYNPNIFAVSAEELLKKAGVEILFGTIVCDVLTSEGRITHLMVENKSGRSAVAAKNVVDATGDADICKQSHENTATFGQGNVPAAWYYAAENHEYRLRMLGYADIPDSQKTEEQRKNAQNSVRFQGLCAKELSQLVGLSHQTLLKDFLKGGNDSKNHAFATVATVPQIRMTRRIVGVYTQDDCEQHKEYADSVGLFSDWRKPGPVYELPFSCLHGKTVKNLICAGRCISSTDAMWDITRVIPVCAVSGQAAGTAAAMTDDFPKVDLALLQENLKKSGVVLHEREL